MIHDAESQSKNKHIPTRSSSVPILNSGMVYTMFSTNSPGVTVRAASLRPHFEPHPTYRPTIAAGILSGIDSATTTTERTGRNFLGTFGVRRGDKRLMRSVPMATRQQLSSSI